MKRMYRKRGTPPRIICDELTQSNPNIVGPCHVIRGVKNRHGYGQVNFNGAMVGAHRYVWEREVGPIPAGMVIDHQCKNRACCNVDHLRVVTPRVNILENSLGRAAANFAKTHCIRGHEFTASNTYKLRRGRQCVACALISSKARYAKLKSITT